MQPIPLDCVFLDVRYIAFLGVAGVFAETLPEQGSVAAAESVWCLQALSSLPNLLKSMKGGE